jgi:hypothetical protein
MSQNNTLVLVGFYRNLYNHQASKAKFSQYLIVFFVWKICRTPVGQCFLLDKSCRKMYTIFSAVLRQQRKRGVMTYLGSPLAAPSIIKQVPHYDIFLAVISELIHWYRTWGLTSDLGVASRKLRLISINMWTLLDGFQKFPSNPYREVEHPSILNSRRRYYLIRLIKGFLWLMRTSFEN